MSLVKAARSSDAPAVEDEDVDKKMILAPVPREVECIRHALYAAR